MTIRLTQEAKAYLELVHRKQLTWLSLDVEALSAPNSFRYRISWTKKFHPNIEKGVTIPDGIVIVVSRKHAMLFENILVGCKAGKDGTEVVILENQNAIIMADGIMHLLGQ